MIKPCKSALFLAGMSLIRVDGAAAQSPVGSPQELHAARSNLEEVVVTARKREERLLDVPVAITAVTGADLARQPVFKTSDLGRVAPGLFVNDNIDTADSARFTIRGQNQAQLTLYADSSVGIYMDDVNFARAYGTNLALFDLERVEVLKGPQGTLYGKNTTGGTVHLITRKPTNFWEGYVNLGVGNYDARTVSAAINVPLVDETLALRVAGNIRRRDGYAHNALGHDLADENKSAVRAHLLFTPGDQLSLLLSGDWATQDEAPGFFQGVNYVAGSAAANVAGRAVGGNAAAGIAALRADQAAAPYFTSPSALDGKAEYDGGGLSLNASYDFGAHTVKSVTALRKLTRRTLQDLDASRFDIFKSENPLSDKYWSEELQISGDYDGFNWVAGAFHQRENGTETIVSNILVPLNPAAADRVTRTEFENQTQGIFAQGTWEIVPRLDLTAGARWSWEERQALFTATGGETQVKFDDYSYNLTLDYKLADDMMVYAATRHGFRGGGVNGRNLFDIFAPEFATDYELGFKANVLDNRLRATLAVYHTDYKDIQKLVVINNPNGSGLLSVIENAASADIDGFELSLNVEPVDDLILGATLNRVNARYARFIDATGDRSNEPFDAPPWTYALSAQYGGDVGAGILTGRVDWYWQDETIFSGSSTLKPDELFLREDSYSLLSGQVSLALPRHDLDFVLWGTNLTNRKYLTNGIALRSSLGFDVAMPGAPRMYGLEIRKRF